MATYDKATLGAQATELGFIRDTLEKVLRLTEILGFINTDPHPAPYSYRPTTSAPQTRLVQPARRTATSRQLLRITLTVGASRAGISPCLQCRPVEA